MLRHFLILFLTSQCQYEQEFRNPKSDTNITVTKHWYESKNNEFQRIQTSAGCCKPTTGLMFIIITAISIVVAQKHSAFAVWVQNKRKPQINMTLKRTISLTSYKQTLWKQFYRVLQFGYNRLVTSQTVSGYLLKQFYKTAGGNPHTTFRRTTTRETTLSSVPDL